MNKRIVVNGFALLFALCCNGQINYNLPKGYATFIDFSERAVRVDKDFDNDGISDLAILCSKKDQDEYYYLLIYMSSTYSLQNTFYYIPIAQAPGYDLTFENAVLNFGGCFGNGRYCEKYKFKYYSKIANMRLIGYDEESLGNLSGEGLYKKSVNLLTNFLEIEESEYNVRTEKIVVVNEISTQVSIPIITLDSFDEKTISYLNNLGSNYFKNN